MEEVFPWVDVFELAQVFMWMVEEKGPKHYWQRPVHWAHVRFDSRLPSHLEQRIRALAAICSVRSCSPADGAEVVDLLDSLFAGPVAEPAAVLPESGVFEATALGTARAGLERATAMSEIEALCHSQW